MCEQDCELCVSISFTLVIIYRNCGCDCHCKITQTNFVRYHLETMTNIHSIDFCFWFRFLFGREHRKRLCSNGLIAVLTYLFDSIITTSAVEMNRILIVVVCLNQYQYMYNHFFFLSLPKLYK